MITLERQAIYDQLTQTWSSGVPFHLEMSLAVKTIACAILNPSNVPQCSTFLEI